MGASCCRLRREDKYESKPGSYLSEEWISSHRRQASGRREAPSTNGIRDHGLPSEKDEGNVQRMHEGRLTRPQKYHIVEPQHQQLVPVTSAADANQTDERLNVLKSKKEKSPYPGCTHKTPDDTCKELKTTSDLLVQPESEEEEFCSTCFDGYDEENPKILTKCKHHYHLPCILEWMERSNTCPTCEQVLFIDETYQEQ